jgi:hypothetical protein
LAIYSSIFDWRILGVRRQAMRRPPQNGEIRQLDRKTLKTILESELLRLAYQITNHNSSYLKFPLSVLVVDRYDRRLGPFFERLGGAIALGREGREERRRDGRAGRELAMLRERVHIHAVLPQTVVEVRAGREP